MSYIMNYLLVHLSEQKLKLLMKRKLKMNISTQKQKKNVIDILLWDDNCKTHNEYEITDIISTYYKILYMSKNIDDEQKERF